MKEVMSVFLLAGILLLTCACSNASAVKTQGEISTSGLSDDIVSSGDNATQRQPGSRVDENSIIGKIVSVTEKEITLILPVSNRQ